MMSFSVVSKPKRTFWPAAFAPRLQRHVAHYENVLGTALEVQIATSVCHAGPQAESALLAEIDRLESIFNIYSATSEVRRWQETHDCAVIVSPELLQVLADSEKWMQRTNGAFHPAVEAFTQLWRYHAEHAESVDAPTLAQLALALRHPLWQLDALQMTARRLTHLPIALNSVAKGFIVDCAAQRAASVAGVAAVLVNIGGDLRHIGAKPVRVDIANPFADAENALPIATVQIINEGLATSGNYRRGFRIGEQWFSHVLDPRNGHPVQHSVSVSVIAESAMLADILATAFNVMSPAQSVQLADSLSGVGVLIIEANGNTISNAVWQQHAI